MNMLIESVSPELVGAKSTLPACLRAVAAIRGWPDAERETLLAVVPAELLACECFHDKLTRLWRYEFGEPHQVGSELVWGIHMWPPVPVLFDVLACAQQRLPPQKLAAYLALLADPRKHPEYLAEMFPTLRVHHAIPAEHEVGGLGEAGPALPVMDTANLKWPDRRRRRGAGRAGPSGHRASHRHLGRRWRSWVGGVSVHCGSRRRHCRISSRILSHISIC